MSVKCIAIKYLFIGLFLFSSSMAFSQDWIAPYEEAVKSFQNGELEKAGELASESLSFLNEDVEDKDRFYVHQISTTLALQLGDLSNFPELIDEEIELSEAAFGKNQKYIEALKKKAQGFYYSGDFEDAQEAFEYAKNESHSILGAEAPITLSLQSDLGQLYAAQNQWGKAYEILSPAMDLMQKSAENTEDYIFSLFVLGQAHYHRAEFNESIENLSFFIQILNDNGMESLPEYAQAVELEERAKIESGQTTDLSDVSSSNLTALLKSAMQEQNVGNSQKAIEYYEKAEGIIKEEEIQNRTSFSILVNFANLKLDENNHQKAEGLYETAAAISNQVFDSISFENLILKQLEAKIYQRKGQTEKHLTVLGEMKLLASQIDPQNSFNSVYYVLGSYIQLNELIASWEMAKNYYSNSEYVKALSNQQKEKFLQLFSEISILAATVSEALPLLEDAQFNHWKENENWNLNYIRLAFETGDYTTVIKTVESELENSKSGEHETSYRLLLANSYQKLANYPKAEENFQKAIDNLQQNDNDELEMLLAQNSLATYYMDLGNYDKAESIFKDILTKNRSASFLQNLATLYQVTNRNQKAIILLKEALTLDSVQYGVNHPNYALTLQNLASAHKTIGNTDEALALYRQSIKIDEANNSENTIGYANKLNNYAMALQEDRRIDEAEKYLIKALEIRENKLGNLHPEYAFNLYGLAVLNHRKDNMAVAKEYFDQAIPIYINQIKNVFPILSEKEKSAFYANVVDVVSDYQEFAIDYSQEYPAIGEDLFKFRMLTKAILLNASSSVRKNILKGSDEALKQDFMKWLNIKEELAQLYSAGKEIQTANLDKIKQFENQANDLEKTLSRNSKSFEGAFSSSVDQYDLIVDQLNENEAIVEIIRQKLNIKNDSVIYAAIILNKELEFPKVVVLPNGLQMEDREFKRYFNSVRYKVANNASHEIYWSPIAEELGEINTVYISPDGVFNKINLATMQDPSDDKFVLEKYDLRLLTNPTAYLKKINLDNNSLYTAALLGNPMFGNENHIKLDVSEITEQVANQRSFELLKNGIAQLPGTKIEIEKIGGLLNQEDWNTQIFTEEIASESSIKNLSDARILHFATHGYFIESSSSEATVDSENPLLRSGLLLSGVEEHLTDQINNINMDGEDGMLTAYEAMNLNLFNTELVVLSACETGSGELKDGEGVYGLQRSFLVAGAEQLVMSLWKVDDLATQELMVNFYQNWIAGDDYSLALRNAQLQLKEKYPEPYYWGAFVLTK
ncbi:CHAT domain-containing protein [Marivirga salinae]|uniref:CHAT domain-containing protein n=1 Tax=Marivirga salinarum TaxID=3059078 RepID=A0AA51NC98_9BACT|nr:CHAT domain-containing protein [Marivirga sp. BDSF4-3]WMN12771.1 CHAT domain-containing protein [Marivirga sp. BDSF4-3]